ncbi:hypothetical protein HPB47_018824 [Ixodes persulcatus]|uniref:Uncharacterized protein n=1 Tax=Ixodes persulcatus TaxID=34615 RepID=A0AC60QZS3_IXOPE|nr:hypothetical protein HPB47_018824 [Ixodes persulcatus]
MSACQRYLTGFPFVGEYTSLEFQEEVPIYRICSLCGAVPSELFLTKCSHFFCPKCFSKLKDEDGFTCPVDNTKSLPDQVYHDTTSANILQGFRVACPNKSNGCEYVGPLNNLKEHVSACGYHGVQCGICMKELKHQDVAAHLKMECQRSMQPQQAPQQEAGEGSSVAVYPREDGVMYTVAEACQISEVREKLDDVCREVKSLKNSFAEFDVIRSTVSAVQDTVKIEMKKMREDSAIANKRIVTKIEKIQSYLKGRIDSIEDRFRSSKFVWHIKNFSKLKEQVMDGKAKSFFSDDFYVGIQGYKMYLGGHFAEKDDKGKTCLSVYVYITKGPYDPTLEWPYKRRSTFVIVDQKSNTYHKIAEIVPEELGIDLEHCFQRPKDGENEGIGYTAIMSLEDIENPENGYVVHDSFVINFITCEV